MAGSNSQFAVINYEASSDLEKKQTQHLHQYLIDENLYDTPEEALLRQEVLGKLDGLVKRWVKLAASANGWVDSMVQEANAKIFTFGSYRLGVHAPGADIDVLCVGPQFAKREIFFFGEAPHCLEHVLRVDPEVSEVTAVPKAYVPVLKIKFCGLELDILYANLQQYTIPENLDLSPNTILRGCDEQTVRALNGCRVTDTILKSVPNVQTFRLALKAVKLWAEKRGIYSNVSGYLGGVNMALLVAKVCKWYPKKEASAILSNMFMFFKGNWPWPMALHLVPQNNDPHMTLPVWDPHSLEAQRALMPIITPAYPAMNSTYNVTRCTMEVMRQEFERAFEMCKQILYRPSPTGITDWGKVFQPYNFFETKQAFYVVIELTAGNDADMEKWDGWVRSRVRHLVRSLEEHTNVRPFPDSLKVPIDQDLDSLKTKPNKPPGLPSSSGAAGGGVLIKKEVVQEEEEEHKVGVVEEEEPKAEPPVAKPAVPEGKPRKAYFLSVTKAKPADLAASAANQPYALQRNAGATTSVAAAGKTINVTAPIKNFKVQVMSWDERCDGMDLNFAVFRQKDLPVWLFREGYNPLLVTPPATNGTANGTANGSGSSSLKSKDSAPADGSEAQAGVVQAGDLSTADKVAIAAVTGQGADDPEVQAAMKAAQESGNDDNSKKRKAENEVTDDAQETKRLATGTDMVQQGSAGEKRKAEGEDDGLVEPASKRLRSGAEDVVMGGVGPSRQVSQGDLSGLSMKTDGSVDEAGSSAVHVARPTTPELLATASEAQIIAGGQAEISQWLGSPSVHLTEPQGGAAQPRKSALISLVPTRYGATSSQGSTAPPALDPQALAQIAAALAAGQQPSQQPTASATGTPSILEALTNLTNKLSKPTAAATVAHTTTTDSTQAQTVGQSAATVAAAAAAPAALSEPPPLLPPEALLQTLQALQKHAALQQKQQQPPSQPPEQQQPQPAAIQPAADLQVVSQQPAMLHPLLSARSSSPPPPVAQAAAAASTDAAALLAQPGALALLHVLQVHQQQQTALQQQQAAQAIAPPPPVNATMDVAALLAQPGALQALQLLQQQLQQQSSLPAPLQPAPAPTATAATDSTAPSLAQPAAAGVAAGSLLVPGAPGLNTIPLAGPGGPVQAAFLVLDDRKFVMTPAGTLTEQKDHADEQDAADNHEEHALEEGLRDDSGSAASGSSKKLAVTRPAAQQKARPAGQAGQQQRAPGAASTTSTPVVAAKRAAGTAGVGAKPGAGARPAAAGATRTVSAAAGTTAASQQQQQRPKSAPPARPHSQAAAAGAKTPGSVGKPRQTAAAGKTAATPTAGKGVATPGRAAAGIPGAAARDLAVPVAGARPAVAGAPQARPAAATAGVVHRPGAAHMQQQRAQMGHAPAARPQSAGVRPVQQGVSGITGSTGGSGGAGPAGRVANAATAAAAARAIKPSAGNSSTTQAGAAPAAIIKPARAPPRHAIVGPASRPGAAAGAGTTAATATAGQPAAGVARALPGGAAGGGAAGGAVNRAVGTAGVQPGAARQIQKPIQAPKKKPVFRINQENQG